ncbi:MULTISPECIES: hypothetical protein [Paenibacillus]|uniref:hypothetical protein n=1 Tax=Paenibacillus TaxID=44249 RepID=UPI001140A528|nr:MULTISPECIES: hypothetical protein [Paenibacillus]
MFDVINLSEAKGEEGGLKMLEKQGLAFVFGFADGVMKKTEGKVTRMFLPFPQRHDSRIVKR